MRSLIHPELSALTIPYINSPLDHTRAWKSGWLVKWPNTLVLGYSGVPFAWRPPLLPNCALLQLHNTYNTRIPGFESQTSHLFLVDPSRFFFFYFEALRCMKIEEGYGNLREMAGDGMGEGGGEMEQLGRSFRRQRKDRHLEEEKLLITAGATRKDKGKGGSKNRHTNDTLTNQIMTKQMQNPKRSNYLWLGILHFLFQKQATRHQPLLNGGSTANVSLAGILALFCRISCSTVSNCPICRSV